MPQRVIEWGTGKPSQVEGLDRWGSMAQKFLAAGVLEDFDELLTLHEEQKFSIPFQVEFQRTVAQMFRDRCRFFPTRPI